MRIAIQQSDYLPWKGYFDLIRSVDLFIIYDDVQFTRRDWRNRNRIKTPSGNIWLTIPVKVKGRYSQLIKEVEVADSKWATKHWKAICYNYRKAPYFEEYKKIFEAAFQKAGEMKRLSGINKHFICLINSILNISTPIKNSEEFFPEGRKVDRILSICKNACATEYLTGPSGMNYLNAKKNEFSNEGIKIRIADYTGYPEYNQQWAPFSHFVSVIDLIFNTGNDVLKYMRKF